MTNLRGRLLGSLVLTTLCAATRLPAQDSGRSLIVVKDFGGTSALPYYRSLNIQASPTTQAAQSRPPMIAPRHDEGALTLPIRSPLLSPGDVTRRVIAVPGLSPMFLIGNDTRSREWLRQRAETLRSIQATGFVVHVDTDDELAALRSLVPGVTIVPTSGDDFARRMQITHYPVLITATGIEQ
jgi:integrating conjugative element protein (TIGR03765 family)